MQRLLFHRRFQGYTGGHGKVFDYFRHATLHAGWSASIYFSQGMQHPQNPWHANQIEPEAHWRPEAADALFLAGLDWQQWLAGATDRPVINLIQHVRHGDPTSDVYPFLERRALRICVSQPVADAIVATGRVCGPVHVINAALDLPAPGAEPPKREGVVVAALKQPELGRSLAQTLRALGHEAVLLDAPLPRAAYLAAIARAKLAVFLPHRTEGFYLPALEAMALGCAVVVPDCIGNRAYVEHRCNALLSDWSLEAIVAAVEQLRDPLLCETLVSGGVATAERFTQAGEREAFHRILDALPRLWGETA